MNAIDRMKTPPVMIGLFVAGLLLFAVVGIVRSTTALHGAKVAQAMQSNVAGAVARPVAPTAIPTASILPIGATKVDPNDGTPWVNLRGAVWLSCRHLDPLSFAYNANATDPALLAWQAMTVEGKREITRICHE